ncbi:MAG: hypothetical protein AAGH99_12385 [Planctomycetota bacterium]
MPRQVLILTKIMPGVDIDLDTQASTLSDALDLRRFIDPNFTGRGLLHWASWYDPWLMFNDLCPDHWSYGIYGAKVANEVWQLDLSRGWSIVERACNVDQQWQEQSQLLQNLWWAYSAFQSRNRRAVLYYGRSVFGGILSDDEILGRA